MPETRSRSLEEIDDAFNETIAKQIKRSSGIYDQGHVELEPRHSTKMGIQAVSPHLSRSNSVGNSDTTVMGPAPVKAMASVESIKRWPLR